jgi:hypothetical protein
LKFAVAEQIARSGKLALPFRIHSCHHEDVPAAENRGSVVVDRISNQSARDKQERHCSFESFSHFSIH